MTSPRTPTIGFLHTAGVHVATFDALLPGRHVGAIHVVDESLLTIAQANGLEDIDLRDGVTSALEELARRGAGVIVCTCSTIGALAEQLAPASVEVQRVDRAMIREAVSTADHIAVVAAVESTIGPTVDLIADESDRQDRRPTVVLAPCLSAWALWERRDLDGYLAAIASHVDSIGPAFDTIVLAQASMAGALALVERRAGRRVLCSPAPAVDAASAALRGTEQHGQQHGSLNA